MDNSIVQIPSTTNTYVNIKNIRYEINKAEMLTNDAFYEYNISYDKQRNAINNSCNKHEIRMHITNRICKLKAFELAREKHLSALMLLPKENKIIISIIILQKNIDILKKKCKYLSNYCDSKDEMNNNYKSIIDIKNKMDDKYYDAYKACNVAFETFFSCNSEIYENKIIIAQNLVKNALSLWYSCVTDNEL